MLFEHWLGKLLCQDEREISRLLADRTALRFLIAWSLFESKCFAGFVRIGEIEHFSKRIVAEGFDTAVTNDALAHFHNRYQCNRRYQHLMHRQACRRMDTMIQRSLDSFTPEDKAFFVTLVAYRFRNNMFHGNKGVASWLKYTDQISLCTSVIGHFVSHAEEARPSLPERDAA
jgi:hypothetical protein